jgi:hypothetical protein
MNKLTLALIAIFTVCLITTPLRAAEVLPADTIRTVLVNNAVVWDGEEGQQKQYFNAAAETVVDHDGTQREKGTWTVTDDGMVCSKWPSTPDWSCYQVSQEGNKIFWQGPVKNGAAKVTGETLAATLIPTTATETGIAISMANDSNITTAQR